MRAGQRVVGLRVVEVLFVELGPLPIGGRVALCAGLPKAALVLVHVAGGASRSEAHPCVIEVFCVQHASRCRGYALRIVAGAAGNADVFSVERESGLGVVEAFGRRIPMDQREVLPVVVRVAFHACRSRGPCMRIGGMKPLVALQLIGDLAVALHTAKRGRLG